MRRDPLGQLPPEAEATLKLHVAVEQQPLTLPREGETILEAFGVQATDGPVDLADRDAFHEIRHRPRGEVIAQLLHRAQRQAGPGHEVDMPHRGELGQHHLARRLACLHQRPGSPFAAMPLAEPHVVQIAERLAERVERLSPDGPVDMDHHRAISLRPVPRHLRRAGQRRMADHGEAQRAHAQFPLDMRPRISNWRQLM
jgi:hypothetical protein